MDSAFTEQCSVRSSKLVRSFNYRQSDNQCLMEEYQIKTESLDDESTAIYNMELENGAKVAKSKLSSSVATIEDYEIVDIKSEISLGEYECTPSVTPATVAIKVRKIEELLQTDPQQPNDPLVIQTEFKCEKCGKVFDQRASLTRHVRQHSRPYKVVEDGFPCEFCGMKFFHETTAMKHRTIHTGQPLGEKELNCNKCGKRFKTRAKLRNHQMTHGDEQRQRVTCDICGKTLSSKSYLPYHMRIHFDAKPWECKDCGKGFAQKVNLEKHRSTSTHTSKLYECDECDKKFVQKKSLDIHKLKHSDVTPFVCDICGKGYTSNQSLSNHKLTHSTTKEFGCDECSARFVRRHKLTYHQNTVHRKEKRFTCDECGMQFFCMTSLNYHKVTHTGARPYSCDECGKKFGYKSGLRQHKFTHSGDQKFSCDDCGMKFKFKHVLQKHQKRHSGSKAFICVQCGKGFTTKTDLDSHKTTHSVDEATQTCNDRPEHTDKSTKTFVETASADS